MDIKTYLKQHKASERRRLADAAGTKLIYLRQMSNGSRRPSAEMAVRLEHASHGIITARELRPDLPWPGAPRASPERSASLQHAA
jgi:DNA-binding transcriptional regulator YdaS (Cro superfamily)